MSKRTKAIYIFLLVLILLIGLGCILYSPFATWYNERHKAQVQSQFTDIIENTDKSELTAAKEAAMKYNDELYHQSIQKFSPEENGYSNLLNMTGNGLMGIIKIPCIDVSLPIYHTVDANILNMGAGHMPQTSLPVGGENTHCAISAHSGMAGSAMFSELERVQIGDYFTLEILGETLTYQVCQIDVVSPDDSSLLTIVPGEDLVTLITCTPYGINSHRLLVRGTRVYPEEGSIIQTSVSDTTNRGIPVRTKYTIIGITIGCTLGLFMVFTVAILVHFWKKRRAAARSANDALSSTQQSCITENTANLKLEVYT